MLARPVRGKRSSPLSDAVRSGARSEIVEAVRALCDTSSGCWVWQKRLNQYGYANASVAGKHRLVHRIVLEAKIGRPLGKEQAHHICAVRACVNPEHLAPASQAENIAEMHARNAMEYRIRSLEAAVRELDPKHPLLASDLAFL